MTRELKLIVLLGGVAVLLMFGFMTLVLGRGAPSDSTGQPVTPAATAKPRAQKPATPAKTPAPKVKVAPPKVDPRITAALKAGLPPKIAAKFASSRVVVVELYSRHDPVDGAARVEAASGARRAGAAFVAVDVERNGAAAALTQLLGALPPAPAALIYQRPGTLFLTLAGYHDRTTIEQAARIATRTKAKKPAPAAVATPPTTPATPAP
jgi:hypothetical protein